MRQIVVMVLLCLGLAGCAVEIVPGSAVPASAPPTLGAAPGAPADVPVGNTVNVAAPAEPETRADDERRAVSITDAFWDGWFADRGLRYVPPTIEGGYTGNDGPACADEPSVAGNAYYCPVGNFLAWDEDLMRAGYTQIGDAWVYLVIAHEWAHSVQAQLPDRFVSQAVELQADCLAGASLEGAARDGLVQIEPGDADEIAQALQAIADDYAWTDESSHGNARQRTAAFQAGVDTGVEGCLRM